MTVFTWFAVSACLAASPWTEASFEGKRILLDTRCQPLPTSQLGPFVKLSDGSVLAAAESAVWTSSDGGRSWSSRPLFAEPAKFACHRGPPLLRTGKGVLILAFMNAREMDFRWDQSRGGPLPECRLPVYVVRSLDEGASWDPPQLLQDGYCGALRGMVQLRSGRVVLGCQQAVANPGRHVCFSYVTDDEGKSWKRSNVIDLGKYGGYGDHGGGIEPTIAELRDGRLWMLIRTYRGRFSEAFSSDGGLTWEDIRPSRIEASGSPGQLARLQSGRLQLLWNRFIDGTRKTGRREQLSSAFSDDDGKTWTDPVVLAYDPLRPGGKEPDHRLSYPYVFEYVPGEMWITTVQGPLRIRVREDDFLRRPRGDKTYSVCYVPNAAIHVDGRADEPEWSRAFSEKGFGFPWRSEPAPATEFRAVCDDTHLYFTFRLTDSDVVVLEQLRDEEDVVLEDRAELCLSCDDDMSKYFWFEIDPRGRTMDYRAAYYRQFDRGWNCDGLETKATSLPDGYVVEGRVRLAALREAGLPLLRPGVKVRAGLYRAEFSHDRSGKPVESRVSIHNRGRRSDGPPPIEAWISWVDPHMQDPDFHVPMSLGWLEVVR